jgi:hypothetical protein
LILIAAVLKFASPHSLTFILIRFGGNHVGNSPEDDNPNMTEWTRLKGAPYDENLRLTRVSGNISEFETRLGYRYRCVRENGAKQWFSFRTNRIMKRATRGRGENLL